MQSAEELFALARKLEEAGDAEELDTVQNPLRAIEAAVREVGRAFGGSWLGYHSRVYYANLAPAPPGANFSQEWGLKDLSYTSLGSQGEWEEFDPEQVKAYIFKLAGNVSLATAQKDGQAAEKVFDSAKRDVVSILEDELADRPDAFLTRLRDELEKLDSLTPSMLVQQWVPKGQIMTRDALALGQGNKVPPHLDVLSDAVSIRHTFHVCREAAEISGKAASHLERKARKRKTEGPIGTNVFIGHGRSPLWRELKDFVERRLGLPWDEFNRVPVAGVTNIARLSEMLEAASIALLVMTAEDEMVAGGVQARMNVVHEAGLFQGRLGFTRAIVLLEEGCTEFSNIQGLGQIHFPKGKISVCFEEVRRVFEREDIIPTA